MTTAHEADSNGFAAGFTTPAAAPFDLASPQFRYPTQLNFGRKAGMGDSQAEIGSRKRQEIPGAAANTAIEGPHATLNGPHFQMLPVEQFVGWSVQDVAWTTAPSPGEIHVNRTGPANEPSIPAAGEPDAPPVNLSPGPSQLDFASRISSRVEPPGETAELPQEAGNQEVGREPAEHWPTRSRAQVAGFGIQRTRHDQPHSIVTGAGLASGHRRWAARNLSAEMQAKTVAKQIAETAGGPEIDGQIEVTPAEVAKIKRAGQMSGGLPLLIHPDFRWSAVVDKLCLNRPLADQLLVAAEQLLAGGNGRLLVAGARRGCGTTTLAATISRLLIDQGKRVLMVDADLARAGWTAEMELTSAGSWVSQVEAFEPLEEAMAISRKTNAAMVALQAAGGRQQLPPFLLDYLGQLLRPLHDQFDATVIDLGPISQLLEELSQPSRLGQALLIVQEGGPEAAIELRRSKTTLNAFGITRLAVAQNFAGK